MMRITIDTNDVTPSQPMPVGQTAAADVGAGSRAPSLPQSAAQPFSSTQGEASAAIDSGAPPDWLLDAVGATKAASEALARIGARSAPVGSGSASSTQAGSDRTGTDAGPGPAVARTDTSR